MENCNTAVVFGCPSCKVFSKCSIITTKGPSVQYRIISLKTAATVLLASQASGSIYNHPQMIAGPLALSTLPPGYSWAPSNCYSQSHSPVIISREHPNIYLQSHPQTAVNLPVVTGQLMSSTSLSSPIQVSHGVQTIATQTSAPSSLNSNTTYYSPQESLKMLQVKAVSQMSYSRKAFKANQKSQRSLEQNVGTSAQLQLLVNSGSSSERLIRPNTLASSQPPVQQTESKVITSTQTESTSMETEPTEIVNNTMIDQGNQFSSPQLMSQSIEIVSSKSTASVSQIESSCSSTTLDSAVTSTESSAAANLSMPIINNEELSSNFIPQCDDNSNHDADSEQPVPDSTKKPTADIEPVPDTTDSITNLKSVSEKSNAKSSTKQPNVVRFNPVIKLKRLKPQEPIQTPYMRTNKDKQLQKAIVKPQMFSPVIASYVIKEVTLKSVSDSSTTVVSEQSNSEMKHDGSTPIPSPDKENSTLILKETVAEGEHVPKFKVSRGRGRPRGKGRGRGRGRGAKQKQEAPLRRSLRQKGDIDIIESAVGENATEMDSVIAIENADSSQMDSENVPPVKDTDLDSSFNISTIAAVPSETGNVATNIPEKSPDLWSVQEVSEFIQDFLGCVEFAETFKSQEIDGQALLLMKLDHLMTGMSMKLGPALKLIAHINSLKAEASPV
ncbi:polyhomeotic-like protein 1 [Nephila pilipes]|uniref:Polyhomeotic-like protein 1 n=1 Tax=Nephila pilipes TaxID=299642 RepID=A0A8X6PWG2_NEPPI|nr:polyhomeotic-like protein 1 [Nephila pilipes]